MPQTNDLLSTAQVAQLLDKSVRTVHRMAQSGRLRAVKLGAGTSSWVFNRADIETFAGKKAS